MNNQLILIEDLGMIYPNKLSKQKRRFGLYKCFCGNEFEARISSVKSSNTNSCGCLHKKAMIKFNTTHNLSKHRLYSHWKSMISRCNNKNNINYKNYGGRGITICDEWLDINNFIKDMDYIYNKGLTLDRIDVNGNYCKENCRWETKIVQNRNTRKLYAHNTSGYRGVSFHKINKNWISNITINNKTKILGYYKTAIEAAKVRDKYIIANNLEHTLNFTD